LNTIIAITHDPEDGRDRCTAWLAQAGYDVRLACPAAGDAIPDLDDGVAGIVVFGGKYDVKMQGEHSFLVDELRFIEAALARDVPFLGICLGGQLLAHVLGEDVDLHPQGYAEYGYYDLMPTDEGKALFDGGLKVLQSHWHGWYGTPRGATRLAYTKNFPQQAFRFGRHAYGLQFHPEATRPMLEKWIGRRPAERYRLKGTHLPGQQLEDNLAHDAALGRWFHAFLSGWIGPAQSMKEAAE
jgi:GMP synthase (glutamine-hydrolysing)